MNLNKIKNDIWSILINKLEGKRLSILGNDQILKTKIEGYLIFLSKQTDKIILRSESIFRTSNMVRIGDSPVKSWFLQISIDKENIDSSILPCWNKFQDSNCRKISKILYLPFNLESNTEMNIQEEILYSLNFKIFPKDVIFKRRNFEYLLFENDGFREDIWDLLSLF